jgi:hypothetical protein
LRYIIEDINPEKYNEVLVITDSLPASRRKKKAIEKGIKSTLKLMLPAEVRYRVLHHSSKSSIGLQLSDYCNWAVYRKWAKNDRRSYDLISAAIRSEFDVFKTGDIYYY